MGRADNKPHMFSVSEAALLLGISKSYLSTLEREHSMYARRNQRDERVYSAGDIAILRRMGVGQRPGRLRFEGVEKELGLHAPFGFDPPRGSLGAQEHVRVVKLLEQKELERLRTMREEARRQRAREWRENEKELPPELRESPVSPGPTDTSTEGARDPQTAREHQVTEQEGDRRGFWSRLFGRGG